MRLYPAFFLTLLVVGCGKPSTETATRPTQAPERPDETDHSHERGKMLLADAGSYHALLTAHLSKDGHELDLFFETTGRNPKPVALPLLTLKATVQIRTGGGELKEMEFAPAPVSERPKDEAAETCSHFIAKVPWLNPDAEHRVILRATLDGTEEEIRWNRFIPRKYAHRTD